MPNDSTTGGYLQPTAGNALDDQALDHLFHDLTMNLTGIGATLIFPRWQEIPPNMPPNGTAWIAQGVESYREDDIAWTSFDPASGIFTMNRNQEIDLRISFYGPNAMGNFALFRDNIQIGQNRDVINSSGLMLVKVGDPRVLPDLLNERWLKRVDTLVTFRRMLWRQYPVDSLIEAPITVQTDTTPQIVNNVTAQ